MRHHLRAGLAATAASAVLAATALPALAAGDGSSPPPASPAVTSAASEPDSTTVTLVTGDKVAVSTLEDGTTAVSVVDGPASTGGVQTLVVGDDTYVIPDAAQKYLAAGQLDRELFNVTGLVELGYDDEHRDTIPLIAQYDQRLRATPATPAGAETGVRLPSIGGAALTAETDDATAFWSSITGAPKSRAASTLSLGSSLTKLWLDGKVESTLDVSVPQVGAPEAWAEGYDGTGATVVVLDTGYDEGHPDLQGVVTGGKSFVPNETTKDVNGHGTHVTSTVAGSGAASNGLYKGVAPGAKVVMGKVLDDTGFGQDSWIIAGMEWASATAPIVSMSLGDDSRTDESDPLSQALNSLSEENGTLFVVAAGNSGAVGTVDAPGTAQSALTVAAVDDEDELAPFSSQGPRGLDDGLKPDVAAPGVNIVAARSQYRATGSGSYVSLSGTSMATPHVAGAAAILKAAHPDWTGQHIKDAIMSSAHELPDATAYEVGTGRLDVPAALSGVSATGSVYFGKAAWGEDDPAAAKRTITYTNATDEDATLDLVATTTAPDGSTTPLVALAEPTVTVRAGSTADVDVTAAFADAPAVGHYLGTVVATDQDGTVVARTTTGLTREDERYDLDVKVLGRDGEPTAANVTFYSYETATLQTIATDPATGRLPTKRLVPGHYAVTSWVPVQGAHGRSSLGVALLGEPEIDLTGDVDLVLDARKANEVSLKTPKDSVDQVRRLQWYHDAGAAGEYTSLFNAYAVPINVDTIYAAPTTPVVGSHYDFSVRWQRSGEVLDLTARTPAKVDLDPLYQRGSKRLDGKVDLTGVSAGTGTAAEYAGLDVEGKAVVVTADAAVTPSARALAAQAAGAALLIVVDPSQTVGDQAGGTDLPVVSVSPAQGAALLAAAWRGKLTIKGTATEYPDYGYDVAQSWEGSVPTNLKVAPRAKDLAEITDELTDTTSEAAFVGRYDCRTGITCQGSLLPYGTSASYVDYVSTQSLNTWYSEATHLGGWSQRGEVRAYEPREKVTYRWFSPVAAPHEGSGYTLSKNVGTSFRMNVPTASGPGEITGQLSGTKTTARLYQGDTLVRSSASGSLTAPVPAVSGPSTYRYEIDTTRAAGRWTWSTATRTSWTFTADQAAPGLTTLPLLQLGYDVPTDLTGSVRAGKKVEMGLTAAQPTGAVGGGTTTSMTAEVSFDGGTVWEPAKVTRKKDVWTATFATPKSGATTVSLRTSASDSKGNRVQQTVIAAFDLR